MHHGCHDITGILFNDRVRMIIGIERPVFESIVE